MKELLVLSYYLGWAALLFVALAGVWRLAKGPTTLDRMVGFDTLMIAVTGLIALFSIYEGTSEYMELILVITALGFFTTVAYYYYLCQPGSHGGEDFNEEERP